LSLILNIETATTVCSVSLSLNKEVISFKEINDGYTHAENLHVFIKSVLEEAKINFNQIDAIAVSRGPGSYTGLRIGVSAAKGLAYALKIPLIGIDTLQIMTNAISNIDKKYTFFCPMIDARRMEVYTCVYDAHLNLKMPVNAMIINEDSIEVFKKYPNIVFFGDGMPKCKEILEQIPNSSFIDGIFPSSKFMAPLSINRFNEKTFEDVAYFEPYYLKDFLLTTKKA
jgi:tRNA threonylcarbamoyladenosine biosynthesis protein TsaB